MADSVSTQYTENLPPQALAELFAGVQGSNIPGILPLLNQDAINRLMGYGVEGANPFTYTGDRIAGFTPAQEEAFRLTSEGVGSYTPYFNRAEDMMNKSINTVEGAAGDTRSMIEKAVAAGSMSTEQATNLLSQIPGMAGDATSMGIEALTGAGQDLGAAAGMGYASTGGFDPNSISGFYNPYEDQVVEQTLADVREGLGKSDVVRRAEAVGSGAFGGSRSRLLGQELADSAARGAAEKVGAIRSAGYQDASRRAQAAFEAQKGRQAGQANLLGRLAQVRGGLGSSIAGLGTNLGGLLGNTAGGIGALGGNLANIYGGAGRDLYTSGTGVADAYGKGATGYTNLGIAGNNMLGTDINRMLGIGGMQQGQTQRGLDLGYGNFVGAYNQPFNTLSNLGNLASGFTGLGGTQITQGTASTSSNPLMSGLGALASLYGATK